MCFGAQSPTCVLIDARLLALRQRENPVKATTEKDWVVFPRSMHLELGRVSGHFFLGGEALRLGVRGPLHSWSFVYHHRRRCRRLPDRRVTLSHSC